MHDFVFQSITNNSPSWCPRAGADHGLVHRLPVPDPGLLPGLPGGEGRRLDGRVRPRQPDRSAQNAGLRHLRRRAVVGAGTLFA